MKISNDFSFPYATRRDTLRVGNEILTIERLENLDRTIDLLFEELSRGGDPELLESLCPYFGVIWPAAVALTEYLAERGRLWKGKRVLEVGCGLALPSMALSSFGARVTATDFHPDVPRFLARNLVHNPRVHVEYRELNWQSSDAAERLGRYDSVIGSDILYERMHPEQVARALDQLVSDGGELVIADPGRPYLQEFTAQMAARGFESRVEIRKTLEKDIFILDFKRLPMPGKPL